MNWIIETSMAVWLTSVTGTIIFSIWYVIGKLFEKYGYLDVMFHILKISLLFWIVPISFFELYFLNERLWDATLFFQTPVINIVCSLFLIVWLCGVILLSIKYLWDGNRLRLKLHKACYVDGDIYELFCDVCEQLDIPVGKVELVFDYSIGSPCTGGFWKNYVILPNLEYDPEQLQIIFLHELTHYRQKNHLLRHFAQLIFIIHFFNPFVWLLKSKLRYWGEYTCDYEVIPKTKGVNKYFEIITMVAQTPSVVDFLSSNLFENKAELNKRYKLMERSYRIEMKNRLLTPIVAILMICSSTLAVQAASTTIADKYCEVYMNTAEYTEVENVIEEYEECYLEQVEAGVIVEEWDENTLMPLDAGTIYNWNVNPNTMKLGAKKVYNSGDRIIIVATDNNRSGVTFRMGLRKSNGGLIYVTGSDCVTHTFEINSTEEYQVFIQNIGSNTIDVTAFVSVY